MENNDIEKAQSLIERHKEINNMERVLRKTPHQAPQQGRVFNTSWGQFYRHHFPLHSCIRPRYESS